jgi:hypothetical protein
VKFSDSFIIDAPKQEVWNVFMDVEKLGSCVPGCRRLAALSDKEYEADMEVQTMFMKIAFKANGLLKGAEEGEALNVEMLGRPLKLAGLFKTKLNLRLSETEAGKTEVAYEMDLQLTGRLASLGDVMMKGTVAKSAREFAENVRRMFGNPRIQTNGKPANA